jgi:hypothetical protein
MSGIGWEFWGLKFSWLLTALVTLVLMVTTMLTARDETGRHRVDTMAGDEGEEW